MSTEPADRIEMDLDGDYVYGLDMGLSFCPMVFGHGIGFILEGPARQTVLKRASPDFRPMAGSCNNNC